MERNNSRWSVADTALFNDMLDRGMSYKEMARALGRSDKALVTHRSRQGMLTSSKRAQAAAAAERARIVAWLRNGEKEFSDCDIAAHLIEQGEHLK